MFGGISLGLGSIDEALNLTKQALQLARETTKKTVESISLEAICLAQLGHIYGNLGEQELSIRCNNLYFANFSYLAEHFGWNAWFPPGTPFLELAENLNYASPEERVEFLEELRVSVPLKKHRETAIQGGKAVQYQIAIESAFESGRYEKTFELLEMTKTRNLVDVVTGRDAISGNVPQQVLLSYLAVEAKEHEAYSDYWEASQKQAIVDGDLSSSKMDVSDFEQVWKKAKRQRVLAMERVRAYIPNFSKADIGTPIKYPQVLELSRDLGAVVIEFMVTKEFTGIMVIDPDSSEIRTSRIECPEQYFVDLSEAVCDKQAVDEVTRKLWEKLFQPIKHIMQSISTTHIVFVPSRSLNLLPLHAAWYEENGQRQYLLDRYEISYAPSASILHQCFIRSRTKQYNDDLLVITDLNQDAPFTNEEISLIQDLYRDELRIATVNHNSIDILLHDIYGAGCLHICCHGNNQGLYLLQKGIELHDKILSVQEIEHMDLSKTRLVVLSACESGRTEMGGGLGDEYIGLPSSFIVAGVPTIVASLWKVSGFSTTLLMWKLHSCLKEDASVRQALRMAQHWLKDASKTEILGILETLRMRYHNESLNLPEDHPNQTRINEAFWTVESAMNWVQAQEGNPFSAPYWWAGFQLIGWPGKT